MKIIIAGSRNFPGWDTYILVCQAVGNSGFDVKEVVSGTARGIDKSGEEWGRVESISIKQFPADWNKYGKSAGMIRNKEMANYSDGLVAIWDGKSRGTRNMIKTMKDMGKPVYVLKIYEMRFNCENKS